MGCWVGAAQGLAGAQAEVLGDGWAETLVKKGYHRVEAWIWVSPLLSLFLGETTSPPPEASSPACDRGVEGGARGWLRDTRGGSWLRGLVL